MDQKGEGKKKTSFSQGGEEKKLKNRRRRRGAARLLFGWGGRQRLGKGRGEKKEVLARGKGLYPSRGRDCLAGGDL